MALRKPKPEALSDDERVAKTVDLEQRNRRARARLRALEANVHVVLREER